MMALEEKYEITLEQEAGEKIQTVGHAVDLIKEVIGTK
jgi:acyl carrier protein